MVYEGKASFLNRLQTGLENELTVVQMRNVLSIIEDALMDFTVCEIVKCENEDDLLNAFLDAMRVEGRSPKTVVYYEYIIGRMLKNLGIPCGRITVHHLRGWLAQEKERGIADSTLNGWRQVYSAFFGWLHREGLIASNPVANLGTIKCPKKRREAYSECDLERLNAACENDRDRAIVAFLASTGCRIGEVVILNRDALDFSERKCTVHGKGNKERIVYFSEVAGMLLKRYLDRRTDASEALFVGRGTDRLSDDGFRAMLKKLSKRAGVSNVHPHRFRRTRATTLNRHGMPIQEISALLGHEKLDTTMRYVALCDDDIKTSFRRYA